jgi:hypothetical protein
MEDNRRIIINADQVLSVIRRSQQGSAPSPSRVPARTEEE